MSKRSLAVLIPFGPMLLAAMCAPPQPNDVGGLTAEDFELISLNGFDPADNKVDINDYPCDAAWAAYSDPAGARISNRGV